MSLKKLAGQTAIYGGSSIIGRLLNYMILTPLFTYIFREDIASFGMLTELYSYLVFLLVILTYGMETAFFRYSKLENPQKVYSNALISLFFTSSIFVFVIFLQLDNIANFLDYSANPEYIMWFAIIIGIDTFSAIPFAKLRNENKALKFAGIKLITIFITIALNLYFLVLAPYLAENTPEHFLLYFYTPNLGIAYVFIANLIASSLTLLLLSTEIIKVKISFDVELAKKMLKFALPLLVVGLAGSINEVLDRVLLKFLLPDKENAMAMLGIYGANYKLSILMTLFIQTFRYAAEPFFFSTVDKKGSKKMYADIMKYFIIFGLFIFLGVMMYIDILKYFIAPEFHSGLNIVPVLLLANLFLGIIFNLSIWYKLTNLTKYGAVISVIGALITISLNVLLIPTMGIMGSAWATFFCYFSMMVISFYWGRKIYFVDYDLISIFKYFVIVITLYFISITIEFNSEILKYLVNTVVLGIFFIYFVKNEKIDKLVKAKFEKKA